MPLPEVLHVPARDFHLWTPGRIRRVADIIALRIALRRRVEPERAHVEIDFENLPFDDEVVAPTISRYWQLRAAFDERGVVPSIGLFPGKHWATVPYSLAVTFGWIQLPFYQGRTRPWEKWREDAALKLDRAGELMGLGCRVMGHLAPRRSGYAALQTLGWPPLVEPDVFVEQVVLVRAALGHTLLWAREDDPMPREQAEEYIGIFLVGTQETGSC